MKRNPCVKCLAVLVAFLLFTSIVLMVLDMFLPQLIKNQILQQTKLLQGTTVYTQWENLNVPVYSRFYLFNVENPSQVAKGAIPILRERGPYTYRQWQKKQIVGWSEDFLYLSYRVHTIYEFDLMRSVGSEGDEVTVLNIPLAIALTVIERISNAALRNAAIDFMKTEKFFNMQDLFVKQSVGKLLFEGYVDRGLMLLAKLHEIFKIPIPSFVPLNGKFMLMGGQNDTDDGLWTVYTGKDQVDKIASVYQWNGRQSVRCWAGPECNSINGTDGVMFQPFITNATRPQVFGSLINRTLTLSYEQDVQLSKLVTKKYVLGPENFACPLSNPDNRCFSTQKDDVNNEYYGLLNVGSCTEGLPITFSQPHFYQGSQELLNQFKNLNPNKTLHETFAQVEPTLGFTLNARKALQFNIDLDLARKTKVYPALRPTVFPIFWDEIIATADEQTTNLIHEQVYQKTADIKYSVSNGAIWSSAGAATVFIIILIFIFVVSDGDESDEQSLIESEEVTGTSFGRRKDGADNDRIIQVPEETD